MEDDIELLGPALKAIQVQLFFQFYKHHLQRAEEFGILRPILDKRGHRLYPESELMKIARMCQYHKFGIPMTRVYRLMLTEKGRKGLETKDECLAVLAEAKQDTNT